MIMSRMEGSTSKEREEISKVISFTLQHPLDLWVWDSHPNFNTDKYDLPLFSVPVNNKRVFLARDKQTKQLVKVKTSDWVKEKPRAYTRDEMQVLMLKHMWGMVDYWLKEDRKPDTREKLSGLMHSFLAMLDGCCMDICGFELYPSTHPTDKAYHIENGENYFDTKIDIGGGLHEIMYRFDPER